MTSFSNELYHHGVKGMKWGVRRTPEQLGKPQRTKEQLKRDKKRDKALAAKRKANAKQAKIDKKAAKRKAQFERDKEKISKSPRLVMKNRDMFTNAELKQALERFKLEADITKITDDQRRRGKQMVEDIVKVAETSVKGYNLYANIYNTINEPKKPLPIIDTGGKKKKKKGESDQNNEDDD